MIYGYIRTSRAAVDGLAGMHPETQVQTLAEAGVEPARWPGPLHRLGCRMRSRTRRAAFP